MKNYILKCIKCGSILDEDDGEDFDICADCDYKELKRTDFAKKTRDFKRADNKKKSHRTKKRDTKPRREVSTRSREISNSH